MRSKPGYATDQIYRWLLRGRWLLPAFIVAASALHEVILRLLQPLVPPAFHPWTPVVVYGFTGTVVTWLGLSYLAQLIYARGKAEAELRRAYEQLKETHRRLLAMHDIGREIAQAADMRQVLEVAARAPVKLANAKGATVLTFDEEHNRLQLEAAWGLSDRYIQRFKERLQSGVLADRCRRCTVLEAHVSDDCPLFDGLQDLAVQEGIGSLACLPFGRGERRDGIITAYFTSPQGPPEDEVQLLAIVAAEIASVLESLRLRRQQVEALHEFEQILDGNKDDVLLGQQLLQITLSVWDVDCGALYRWDEGDDQCAQVCLLPEGKPLPKVLAQLMRDTACQVRRTRAPYVIPDIQVALTGMSGDRRVQGSIAGIPLLTGADLLGAMVLVAETPGVFRAQHGAFLLSVGHYAGLVLTNARLQAQVEHMAVLEERYRLAREIHDGLAQSLTFIGWRLDRAAQLLQNGQWEALETDLEDIRRALREAYLDVREAIDGLRLNLEHPEGLVGALREYITTFQARTGLLVTLDACVDPADIPPEVGIHLLRIVQESLTNVRKHAHATRVWIQLAHENGHLVLCVIDNGRGFDLNAPRSREHVGLSSMRERAEKLNGTFSLESHPGVGTRVMVRVPLRPMTTSTEVHPS